MSTERIKQLHEQASERYLNGDYQGALQAWRDVLELDPADEQARDGSNLAAQFVEHPAAGTAEPSGDVEHELDRGLKVLDGLSSATLLHGDAADGTVDRQAAPPEAAAPAAEEHLEGWGAPMEPSVQDGSFGLEAFSPSTPDPSTAMSAAAAELSRRVNDLLTEAKAKAEAGDRDEALAILFRLAILDEDNAEAAQLRAKIEAASASDLDRVERAIIEGVAALEGDALDDAEKHFQEALELVPGHREAQHYLEKVAQRRAHGEELLVTDSGEAAPFEHAVEHATVTESVSRHQPPAPAFVPKQTRPAPAAEDELVEAPPGTSGPGGGVGSSKILIWGGGAVLVLAFAALALPHLFGGSSQATAARSKPGPVTAKPPAAQPAPHGSKAAPPPEVPVDPQASAKAVASALAKGKALMASGDFGGAVVAFNEALTQDPVNADARAGIEEAGERYKASKAERDALDNIRFAFRDGEFSSGLRLAYRLPPTVSQSYIDGVKFAGWYNLAIVALRAGDCREALSHLDEALTVAPNEGDAKKLREFAAQYVDAVKDRGFLDRVEALSFRPVPPS